VIAAAVADHRGARARRASVPGRLDGGVRIGLLISSGIVSSDLRAASMQGHRRAVHRTIVVVDVEGFGDRRRTNRHQVAVRQGLYRALREAFTDSGIVWADCDRADRGDGVLILAPPEVPKTLFAEPLPLALATALQAHNSTHPVQEWIRLRMAVHAGEVSYDEHGVTAAAVNLAFRLVEAPALKAALARSAGALAVICSSWFFDEVIAHCEEAVSAGYRRAEVRVKETAAVGWIALPDHPDPAGAVEGALSDSSGLSSVGAAVGQPPLLVGLRYSLPPDALVFTGRDGELDRITAAVVDGAAAGGVVAIHAIGGMPGVGKTALAVHAAHLLRPRFADRQLFIDLHAHTPGRSPVPAGAALAGLLAAVGVDARYLPEDLDGRASLWRDRMARQRALLVLDNAASSGQVAPLLPGGEGCLVLVTSRRHLGDLPGSAVSVVLESLPPDKAQQMFLRLAPRAAAGPVEAVAELVRLAGCLPLAISLLARVYARHPSWTLGDLAAETRVGMLTLAAENTSVAAAFGVSYRYLAPGLQRFFRRLGLHPGTTVDAYAAAALAGISLEVAARRLDALHGEGLLAEAGYHRYGMHDLIRRYARDRATAGPAAGRGQALGRLLDYYQHTAALAEARLARQTRASPAPPVAAAPTAVPDLSDSARALAWARADRANLLACLDHAGQTGQHARVVALTAAMAALWRHDGPWTDAIARHAAAATAARHLRDQPGQAGALTDLGDVRQLAGDNVGAAQALEEALGISRGLGDRLGQANALHQLGIVRLVTGDYPAAAQALAEALGIYRGLGDRLGQANALHQLGGVRALTGDYAGAAHALAEALGISRDLGDRHGQAGALHHQGTVRWLTGDFPGAAQALAEALSISRGLGNRLGQANALTNLGAALRLTGDYAGAAQALAEALDISRDLGHRHGQAGALNQLGIVRRLTGDHPGAAQALAEALGIYRDLGHRHGQAIALSQLGAVRRLTGDFPGAAQALAEALGIFRDLGDRGGEVTALNEAGELRRVRDDLGGAGACHRQALDLAREVGSYWDEAHALAGLGRCALAAGNLADAQAELHQAQEIFQRIGAAEAVGVTAELDALTQA
jgi:tetratricopeptide (TPR) repeat protein